MANKVSLAALKNIWSRGLSLGSLSGIPADHLKSIEHGVDELFQSVEAVYPSDRKDLSCSELVGLVLEKMSLISTRGVGYPLKGVQIISVIESRFIPFKVAIVVGCLEGDFPRSLPNDVIVDNYIKTKIGLPSWTYVEAMEDTTFSLLRYRVANIFLLYHEDQNGSPTVRSRFIDRVFIEDPDVKLESGFELKVEPKPVAYSQTRAELDFGTIFKKVSPTSLEVLIHCPYKFLLKKLGLRKIERVSEQKALLQGSWIHLVLEKFFTGVSDLAGYSESLEAGQAIDEKYLTDRMTAIADHLFDDQKIDYPVFYQLRRSSLPKLVSWYHKLFFAHRGFEKIEPEVSVNKLQKKITNPHQFEMGVEGKIDMLMGVGKGRLIIDYKTNSLPSNKDVALGIAPQLLIYAYALEGNDDDLENIVLGYWSVVGGKFQLATMGDRELTTELLGSRVSAKQKNVSEAIDNCLEIIGWRLNQIMTKTEFVADIGPGCDFCDYSNICRHRDPKFKGMCEVGSLANHLKNA